MRKWFYANIKAWAILFVLNILGNKVYAQETISPAIGFQETCNERIITGEIELAELELIPEFWSAYLRHYAEYSLDQKKLEEIFNVLNINKYRHIHIIAVIGTWCGDTKEQFPVLQKILDSLQHSNIHIIYIGADRDKLAGETDISYLNIEFLPTFIFYDSSCDYIDDISRYDVLGTFFFNKYLREIGRIVETPEGTMEEHILKILNKKQ